MCDRQLLYSRWNNTGVIAMTDCLWGVLDGINEHGLTLSLAFGGHDKKGDGFAITLVLRYILEFCSTTMEALAVLQRVPVHMPYNITVLDRAGEARTAVVCPEMDLEVTTLTFATNHQQCGGAMASDAIADSRLREAFLSTRLGDKAQDLEMMHGMFLHEPLLRKASDWNGWGTLYTSRYDVEHGAVELCWPGDQILQQNFNNFQEGTITVTSPAFL
jgi:predicted choloylglycine hydrolase